MEAQSDDNLSSGTEAQNESDLEIGEGLETRAYKWGLDLAKLQADPTKTETTIDYGESGQSVNERTVKRNKPLA